MVILVLVLLAMFSSFAAIFGLLNEAKAATGGGKLLFAALAAATIVVSWTVTQVVFTLHYAHVYYAPSGQSEKAPNALAFPGTHTPDYWDFFYFATSIGAASQTSDVSINSQVAPALGHAARHCLVLLQYDGPGAGDQSRGQPGLKRPHSDFSLSQFRLRPLR